MMNTILNVVWAVWLPLLLLDAAAMVVLSVKFYREEMKRESM